MSATEIKSIRTKRDYEAALAEIPAPMGAILREAIGWMCSRPLATLGPLTSDGTPSV